MAFASSLFNSNGSCGTDVFSTDRDFISQLANCEPKSGENSLDLFCIQSIIRSAPSTTGIPQIFLSLAVIKPSLMFEFSRNLQAGSCEIVIYASSKFFDAKRVELTTLTAKRTLNKRQTKSTSSTVSG